jgi:hypothetical protein
MDNQCLTWLHSQRETITRLGLSEDNWESVFNDKNSIKIATCGMDALPDSSEDTD